MAIISARRSEASNIVGHVDMFILSTHEDRSENFIQKPVILSKKKKKKTGTPFIRGCHNKWGQRKPTVCLGCWSGS